MFCIGVRVICLEMENKCCVGPEQGNNKKMIGSGRLFDPAKNSRAQTAEVGKDGKCLDFKCFQVMS